MTGVPSRFEPSRAAGKILELCGQIFLDRFTLKNKFPGANLYLSNI